MPADIIREGLRAQYPIIWVETLEEDRVLSALAGLVGEMSATASVYVWSCVDGLDGCDAAATTDPCAAIRAIVANPCEGIYVLKDLASFIDRPDVKRAILDAYHGLKNQAKTSLVVLSPEVAIPREIARIICPVEFPLPGADEMLRHVDALLAERGKEGLPQDVVSRVAIALRGLTLDEASHAIHAAMGDGAVTQDNVLQRIFEQKRKAVRDTGVLEFVPNRLNMDDIGGMEILREWAMVRKDLFTQEALEAGLPVPRGVLVMGISGCGKSLSAKAIASLWNVPLFRLDMSMVFSGLYGTPEASFRRALRTIEAVAPAVLWIDEIENALGMTVDSRTAEQTLTVSAFLTWMQERPPLVFVAATANRIESLPAEMIRKGRFDDVFFCDLPTTRERQHIMEIHLRRNGIDFEGEDFERLLYATRFWTGAEIEQAVISARLTAHSARRQANLDDVRTEIRGMVPLSTTMAEQIRAIRDWSEHRAKRASNPEPKSMLRES